MIKLPAIIVYTNHNGFEVRLAKDAADKLDLHQILITEGFQYSEENRYYYKYLRETS